MKVIGAGYGRTGTDSIRQALQLLLGGRCYHMKELAHRRDQADRWMAFVESDRQGMDWAALLEGYVATVDWPCANYYAEILEAFPDAKVLLSVRDPDAWFDSFQVLVRVMKVIRALSFIPTLGAVTRLHDRAVWHEMPDPEDRVACIEAFERHIERVKATVPPEKLLVYQVSEGWEPLCAFLELDVPGTPFPHVNSRADLRRFATRAIVGEVLRAPLDALRGRTS